jgi:hypothetical protein
MTPRPRPFNLCNGHGLVAEVTLRHKTDYGTVHKYQPKVVLA